MNKHLFVKPCPFFLNEVIKTGLNEKAENTRKIYDVFDKLKSINNNDEKINSIIDDKNDIDLKKLYLYCKKSNKYLKEFSFKEYSVVDLINTLKDNLKKSYFRENIYKNINKAYYYIYEKFKNITYRDINMIKITLKKTYSILCSMLSKKECSDNGIDDNDKIFDVSNEETILKIDNH